MRNKILMIGLVLSLAWFGAFADICVDGRLGNCKGGGLLGPLSDAVADLYDDAVAVWSFNEPAGLGLEGGDSFIGMVADFERDAGDEWASIADNGTFTPTSAGRGTCGWLRPETLAANLYVWNKDGAGVAANADWDVYIGGTGVFTAVYFEDDASQESASSGDVWFPAGARNFVCSWWDGAGDDKVHIERNADEDVKDSPGTFATANDGNGDFKLAQRGAGTHEFDGLLGPVYHYEDGFADATQRASLYNSGKGKKCADLTAADKVGMISCWDMDEAVGATFEDDIGDNDLTNHNSPARAAGLIITGDGDPDLYLTAVNVPWSIGGAGGYATEMEAVDYATLADFPTGTEHTDFGVCLWFKPSVQENSYNYPMATSVWTLFTINSAPWYWNFRVLDSVSGNGTANTSPTGVVFERTFLCGWYDHSDGRKPQMSVNDVHGNDGGQVGVNGRAGGAGVLNVSTVGATTDLPGDYGPIMYWSGTWPSAAVRTSLYNDTKGKSFVNLTEAELSGMTNFWAMDEASGDFVDSIGSEDLTRGNTPTRTAAGLVSTGSADDGASDLGVETTGTHHLALGDPDLWGAFPTDVMVTGWFVIGDSGSNRLSVGAGANYLDKGFLGVWTGATETVIGQCSDNEGGWAQSAATDLSATKQDWHFFAYGFDASEKKCFLVIDDGSVAWSNALAGALAVDGSDFVRNFTLYGASNSNINAFDNVAVWPGYDEEIIATLWNESAGTFYAAFIDFIFNGPRFAWSDRPQIRRIDS